MKNGRASAVQAACARRQHRPTLSDEILDRLDPADIDDDDDRPIAEIIADICLDLGLETPFGVQPRKRPTPTDVKTVYERPGTLRPSAPARGAVPPDTRTGSDPPLQQGRPGALPPCLKFGTPQGAAAP